MAESSVSVTGRIVVYGPRSSGKTTFAVTASQRPSKVYFLDGDDSKGKPVATDLKIKQYVDLAELGIGLNEIDYVNLFMEQVDQIPPGQEVIIIDNPNRLFLAPDSYVREHPELFRKHWSSYGPIKGPQEWIVVRKVLLPDIYAKLNQKADLVIWCAHEKKQTDDAGVKTGAMELDVHDSLVNAAGWVVRMTKNWRDVDRPGPVGLQIKPLPGKTNLKTGKTIPILPHRIAPFDWPTIREYIAKPYGAREEVEPWSVPDDDELAIMKGALNEEQRKVYELNRMLTAMKLEEEMQVDIIETLKVVSAPNNHLKAKEVVARLEDKWPGIDASTVKKVLDSMKEVATAK